MKSKKALKRERALLGPSLSEKPRLEVIRWRSDLSACGDEDNSGIA